VAGDDAGERNGETLSFLCGRACFGPLDVFLADGQERRDKEEAGELVRVDFDRLLLERAPPLWFLAAAVFLAERQERPERQPALFLGRILYVDPNIADFGRKLSL